MVYVDPYAFHTSPPTSQCLLRPLLTSVNALHHPTSQSSQFTGSFRTRCLRRRVIFVPRRITSMSISGSADLRLTSFPSSVSPSKPRPDDALKPPRSKCQSQASPSKSRRFRLVADHQPAGDQPNAIRFLTDNFHANRHFQTLHGVTGSGKTFIMANVIANVNRPTLVLAPNKTLAAQLYSEFARYFPHNAVEFFVSHFKHFQPEAYLPAYDKYIAKSSSVDKRIDRLRHAATKSLFERSDIIVVASVSSIYGLGLPSEYLYASFPVRLTHIFEGGIPGLLDALRALSYVETSTEKLYCTRGFFNFFDNTVELSSP